MKRIFRSPVLFFIISFLMAQMVVAPVQAARKTKALVPVVSSDFSGDDASYFYDALSQALTQKQKLHLTDTQTLADYFAAEEQGADLEAEGDTFYLAAKQSYLQFDNKSVEKNLEKAIAAYQTNPGQQSGFYKTYLLQALLEHEAGQSVKARKSIESAIRVDVNAKELKDDFFSPRFREMYASVFEEFIKSHPTVSVEVQVSGTADSGLIYANGVAMGRGSQVVLAALPDTPLFLQAGQNGKLYRVKPKPEGENKIRIRGKISKSGNKWRIGFPASTPNLVPESQWLAEKVGASEVILLSAAKTKGIYDVSVSVVDAATGKLTEPKHFEVGHLRTDAEQASSLMAQYLAGVDKKDFQDNPDDSIPILIGQKKTSGWVYAGLGAAVLVGVGAAVLLSGGSAASNPNADVKVEIPPFEEEED